MTQGHLCKEQLFGNNALAPTSLHFKESYYKSFNGHGLSPDSIPWGSGYESVYYGLWDSTPA